MKNIICLAAFFISAIGFSQEGYELIILDGKEVYMSTTTGEIFTTKPIRSSRTIYEGNTQETLKNSNIHRVNSGETLYSISRKYKMPVAKICELNGILKNDVLRIGQEISINPNIGQMSSTDYVVTKGNTLYSIAKRFHTTVQVLKDLNGLSTNSIRIGQKLRLQ